MNKAEAIDKIIDFWDENTSKTNASELIKFVQDRLENENWGEDDKASFTSCALSHIPKENEETIIKFVEKYFDKYDCLQTTRASFARDAVRALPENTRFSFITQVLQSTNPDDWNERQKGLFTAAAIENLPEQQVGEFIRDQLRGDFLDDKLKAWLSKAGAKKLESFGPKYNQIFAVAVKGSLYLLTPPDTVTLDSNAAYRITPNGSIQEITQDTSFWQDVADTLKATSSEKTLALAFELSEAKTALSGAITPELEEIIKKTANQLKPSEKANKKRSSLQIVSL